MEKRARAHFTVIRINRWSLAVLLITLLAILFWPWGGHQPALSLKQMKDSVAKTGRDVGEALGKQGIALLGRDFGVARVKQGVTLLGRDFSGMTEAEARTVLQDLSRQLQARAEAAREGKGPDGVSYVTPELQGYTLDVDTTWFRLVTAVEGSSVLPATEVQVPPSKLSDFPMSVIRKGNGQKQAVALLINVDWGEAELARMLPTLKEQGAKVTFFVSGKWAERNRALLKLMAQDGHEIATHGYDLSSGPRDLARAGKLKGDIERSAEAITGITGMPVHYYAPHMSEVDERVLQSAGALGLRTVLYSVDTADWMDATKPEMILEKLGRAGAGDLVLMHPKPNTSRVLEQVLQSLRRRNLRAVTLSELLSPEPELPSLGQGQP